MKSMKSPSIPITLDSVWPKVHHPPTIRTTITKRRINRLSLDTQTTMGIIKRPTNMRITMLICIWIRIAVAAVNWPIRNWK